MKKLFLFLGFCLVAVNDTSAQALVDSNNPMAEAMLRMMEAMDWIERYDYPASGGYWGSWNAPGIARPLAPPRHPFYGSAPAWGAPDSFDRRSVGHPGLQGIWQGNTGDMLVIRGNSFRIYRTRDKYLEGRVATKGNIITLYNRHTPSYQRFEFALNRGRLVLSDSDGQLMLYRKIQR